MNTSLSSASSLQPLVFSCPFSEELGEKEVVKTKKVIIMS